VLGLVVGVLLLILLVVYAARTRTGDGRPPATDDAGASLGMSIGMLLGAVLGTIVWISTGEFVFWVVFMGGGLTVGLAMGTGFASRRR
jgi:tetrahydromethanopterin S-methyltransferase subunit G